MLIRSRLVFVGFTLLASLTPLRAEVLDAGPTGFTLQNERTVAVSPAVAWKALVNDIAQWWPAAHTWTGRAAHLRLDARAGGCFCETGEGWDVEHQRVVFVRGERLLRLAGGLGPLQGMGLTGILEWRLDAVENGTRITLWYRAGGYAPEDLTAVAPAVDAAQAQQLGGLVRHLEAL